MGLFSRFLGGISSFFQIGGPGGPGLNNNGGSALEAKNSTNTTFVNMRGADPAGSNDFVTLESLSNSSASPVKTLGRFEYWGGATNGATLLEGFCNCFLAQSGGGVSTIVTSTSLLTSTKRAKFTAPAGSGAVTLGVFDGSALLNVWRGNAAGLGGFTMRLRFAFEAAPTGAATQCFVGLISQSGIGSSFNPTTQTTLATVGVGFSQTPVGGVFSGNWKLITSPAPPFAAPTVTDLGALVPILTTSLMQLDLSAVPNGTSIAYTLTDLSTGLSVTGVINSNFPSSTTFLAMWCASSISSGSTAIAQFDVAEYCYQQGF